MNSEVANKLYAGIDEMLKLAEGSRQECNKLIYHDISDRKFYHESGKFEAYSQCAGILNRITEELKK